METEDAALVSRCLEGDVEAFAVLVDRYQKPLFNVALRMTGEYADAQDLTQTVFLKAYEKLSSYRPEFKFFSWIYRMMINQTLNFLEHQRHAVPLDETMAARETPPDQQHEAEELSAIVDAAVRELPEDYRVVIIMKYFSELSYRDIGRILGVPEKTVKSRLYAARRLLCEMMQQRGIQAHD